MSNLLGLLTGVVGSLVASGLWELIYWLRARKKLKAAVETEFQQALASDSLRTLGKYLDSSIGQFSIAEYGRNQQVRRRVNMFLARVEEFVGKSDEVHPSNTAHQDPIGFPTAQMLPDLELQAVEGRILGGAVWDALALLRRVIEQRLRQLATDHDLRVPERSSASRLVELLRRNNIGDENIWEPLRYAINVCNRGVHGLDVPTNEALGVTRLAFEALEALGLTGTRTASLAKNVNRPSKIIP